MSEDLIQLPAQKAVTRLTMIIVLILTLSDRGMWRANRNTMAEYSVRTNRLGGLQGRFAAPRETVGVRFGSTKGGSHRPINRCRVSQSAVASAEALARISRLTVIPATPDGNYKQSMAMRKHSNISFPDRALGSMSNAGVKGLG